MKTNKLLIGALAFGAGYMLSKMNKGEDAGFSSFLGLKTRKNINRAISCPEGTAAGPTWDGGSKCWGAKSCNMDQMSCTTTNPDLQATTSLYDAGCCYWDSINVSGILGAERTHTRSILG